MVEFQKVARAVRGFYEADTDVEVMQRLIEQLMDEVDDLVEDQQEILTTLNRIAEILEDEEDAKNDL